MQETDEREPDKPGYFVFCVGLSATALALVATWWFNYEFQRAALRRPRLHRHVGAGVGRAAIACVVLGTASTPGLPVLVRCIPIGNERELEMAWRLTLLSIHAGLLQHVVVPEAAQLRGLLVLLPRDLCRLPERESSGGRAEATAIFAS